MSLRTSFRTTVTDERAAPPREVLPDTDLLHPHYRIIGKIGDGGYGAVYEVVDRDYRRLALKIQKVSRNGPLKLMKEFEIYKTLLLNPKSECRTPGIPWVHDYKEYDGVEYMVMERLGDSLDHIAKKSLEQQLTIADVLMIGIQAVRRLRDLHENGILHRDVKPNNLAMGRGVNNERTVHIIDFGLATTVEDWSTYDYDKDVGFAGTRYYASIEALSRKAPTRKGDLESLVYTLVRLGCGNLPWLSKDRKIGRKIRDSELGMERLRCKHALCHMFPVLAGFIEAVASTKRTEKPNYERLIHLLETEVDEFEGGDDGKFEWLEEPAAEVKSASLICSENHQQAGEAIQNAAAAITNNVSEAYPVVPPGFGFKTAQKKDDLGYIRIELLTPNTCNPQKASQTTKYLRMHPSRSQNSPIIHEVQSDLMPASVVQVNTGGTRGPLRNSKYSRQKVSSLELAERQERPSARPLAKTVSMNSESASIFDPTRHESPCDFKYFLFFTLVMADYLHCRNP